MKIANITKVIEIVKIWLIAAFLTQNVVAEPIIRGIAPIDELDLTIRMLMGFTAGLVISLLEMGYRSKEKRPKDLVNFVSEILIRSVTAGIFTGIFIQTVGKSLVIELVISIGGSLGGFDLLKRVTLAFVQKSIPEANEKIKSEDSR